MERLDKKNNTCLELTCPKCATTSVIEANEVRCDCIPEFNKGIDFFFYTSCSKCIKRIEIQEESLSQSLQKELCFDALDRFASMP